MSLKLFILMIVSLLGLTSWSHAESPYEDQKLIGVKLGWLSSGALEIDNVEGDSRPSFSGAIFFDFPYGSSVSYGFAIDLLRMNWKVETGSGPFAETLDESATMVDVSLNFKATLAGSENARWVFRPGVAIGFGALEKFRQLSGSNYLTLKAGGELHYLTAGDFNILLDATAWYAPTGGDRERDVKVGPLVMLRAGLVF